MLRLLKSKKTYITMGIAAIVMASISVPGVLLNSKYNQFHKDLEVLPERYFPTSASMENRSDSLLLPIDRVNIITGIWDNAITEVDDDKGLLSPIQAVKLAKKQIDVLYKLKLYPDSIESSYENWYSWSTKLYRYHESSFNMYSSNLWVITFTKYDNSAVHTILMTEDGYILQAEADHVPLSTASCNNVINNDTFKTILNGSAVKNVENKTVLCDNFLERIASIYPVEQKNEIVTQKYCTTSFTLSNNNTENFLFYQYTTSKSYVYGMIPTQKILEID